MLGGTKYTYLLLSENVPLDGIPCMQLRGKSVHMSKMTGTYCLRDNQWSLPS